MRRLPTESEVAEMGKALEKAEAEWRVFFKRHGFTFPNGQMMNHPSNISFARVVETEHAIGNQLDFPLARKMFMLGYMRGHDAFPMRKDCGLFSDEAKP